MRNHVILQSENLHIIFVAGLTLADNLKIIKDINKCKREFNGKISKLV